LNQNLVLGLGIDVFVFITDLQAGSWA